MKIFLWYIDIDSCFSDAIRFGNVTVYFFFYMAKSDEVLQLVS